MVVNTRSTKSQRDLLLVAVGSVALAVLGTLGSLYWAGWLALPQASRQTAVHDMGEEVMPFDLGQTTHVFEMTESGGVQQVIADDPADGAQVALIQQHLQHEAMLFSSGEYTDPMLLHGREMPGVNELAASPDQVQIDYQTLPNGAQITFTTQDFHLVTAIHRWFGAQLSDHGMDATYR